MLEAIFETGADIVRRSECIIEAARRLVFSGELDGHEALVMYREAERLMEATFAMSDAFLILRRSREMHPERPRRSPLTMTVQ